MVKEIKLLIRKYELLFRTYWFVIRYVRISNNSYTE